jgi:hypothetical protein
MKLTETQLRDAKDEGLTRITEQQKAFGALPNVEKAEDFILPIVEKMDRQAAEQKPVPVERKPDSVILRPGDVRNPGDGSETALGRKRGPDIKDGWKVVYGPAEDTPQHAPSYSADLLTQARAAVIRLWRKNREDPRYMEWYARLIAIEQNPDNWKPACKDCKHLRQYCACQAYDKLTKEFFLKVGDPRNAVVGNNKKLFHDLGRGLYG